MEFVFFQPTYSNSLAAFRLFRSTYTLWIQLICVYEWNNQDRYIYIYIFKKSIKKTKLFWRGLVIFLVFTEETAFKHFLFINITKSRFFLLFSDHTDIKKSKLKNFYVYLINVFRMNHNLKKNFTGLCSERKKPSI